MLAQQVLSRRRCASGNSGSHLQGLPPLPNQRAAYDFFASSVSMSFSM
jgi:hypothetical protein